MLLAKFGEARGISNRRFSGERDLAAFGLGKYLEETLTSFL